LYQSQPPLTRALSANSPVRFRLPALPSCPLLQPFSSLSHSLDTTWRDRFASFCDRRDVFSRRCSRNGDTGPEQSARVRHRPPVVNSRAPPTSRRTPRPPGNPPPEPIGCVSPRNATHPRQTSTPRETPFPFQLPPATIPSGPPETPCMPKPTPRPLFVTDFDGTLTRNDFFHIAVQTFAPACLAERWQEYLAGRITHFQALQAIFAGIRCSEDELLAVLPQTEPPPDLAAQVRRLHAAGWDLVVASAGCEWYIGRILAACQVDLPVYANPGRFEPDQGLIMELPVNSPFFSPTHGIDKAAIVRQGLAAGRRVAFAGDGYSDAEAARLVRHEDRFARADLARALDRAGIPYRSFEAWGEVVQALCDPR
jgi:2,3-diketo-5-methylthio-1-phosphopentane phosphatase